LFVKMSLKCQIMFIEGLITWDMKNILHFCSSGEIWTMYESMIQRISVNDEGDTL